MFQSKDDVTVPYVPWKLILALRSSILLSKDWTLASRMLGKGGLWALSPQSVANSSAFPRGSCTVSCGLCSLRSEESQEATMDSDSVIKCPEPG